MWTEKGNGIAMGSGKRSQDSDFVKLPTNKAQNKHEAASSGGKDDEWALQDHLELAGSVLPPTYQNLRNDAHLNTFDVNANGDAVLLSEHGRLFLLPLFAKQTEKTKKTHGEQQRRLFHVTMDPPLQPEEVQEIEQVKINASGSYVFLCASKWIRVVQMPPQDPQARQKLMMKSTKHQVRGLLTHASVTSPVGHRFCVTFDDGTTEMIALAAENPPKSDIEAYVTKNAPQHASNNIVSIAKDMDIAATVRQVGYFTKVCHAAWHPLSENHLVVLSDAEEISIFNMQQDVSKPEQRHLLDFKGKTRSATAISTTFCFGNACTASQQLWEIFTCYIMRSDGSIYALCPLVPYECLVHHSVLMLLRSEVDAQLALCKKQQDELQAKTTAAQNAQKETTKSSHWIARRREDTVSKADTDAMMKLSSRQLELKSQKYWLNEAWAPVSLDEHKHHQSQTTFIDPFSEYVKCLKPHMSGISPETWPLALQGPVEVSPKSVIENKDGIAGGSIASSIVSVPYASQSSESSVLSPLLVRVFSSGHIELLLLDIPVRPQWKSDKHFVVTKLPALLLDCLNVGVDDANGKAVLEVDPNDQKLVYCMHSTGVHVLNVHWVSEILSGSKQLTKETTKTTVRHVFGITPSSLSSNVVGTRVVKNVFFGHLLLLRMASGAFEVVNVSTTSSDLSMMKHHLDDESNQSSLPETLAAMASSKATSRTASTSASSSDALKPFVEIVHAKVKALTACGTRVKGNTPLNEVDDAVLAFMVERIKTLYEDVAFVDQMDQLVKDRLQLQCDMLNHQLEKVMSINQSMQTTKDDLAKLQDKMERAMAVQQNLRKRAAAVLQAVKENQPHLSKAERQLKQELGDMAIDVRRMKPRVAQLTIAAQRMVRTLENASLTASTTTTRCGLSDDKKKMCYDVLQAETQLIDDTKSLLDDVTAQLQHLQA